MSDGQIFVGSIFALFLLVAIVTCIASHEAKKRKPNIRVPRETLWGRSNRYYRGDE
jgi:hypothetical protein